MAKLPKKPKLKKMPKKPLKSASIEVWKRWKERAAQTCKDNDQKIKDYKSKIAKIEADKKAKEKIQSQAGSMKSCTQSF